MNLVTHQKQSNILYFSFSMGRPSGRVLHLQPSVLDFGAQSVGLPKVQTFCAFNPSRDTDIEVNSVFTSGRYFHVSPVHSMVIPARGKSSFTVVFLPDEEGSFESSLFINTSAHGVVSYQCYQILKKKSVDKFSSDSSSECGSSRGSVRASRGSWGSWSSTSSSDGDKKNTLPNRLYFPTREAPTQHNFPSENPISLNLSHSICNTSSDINPLSHYSDILPPFSEGPEVDKNKGLYPQEDVWSPQPVCLTNDLNYNLENPVPCVTQDPPPVQNSYMNWNSTCDRQFSGIYGSLELNDFNSYPEENMNFHNGFSCPDVQNPAFIDQCQSTWNLNPPAPPPAPPPPGPTMPNSWEPTSYVSNSPYLSSTRSLSPMSGLFGSIWAPQNDVFDGYCPVSSSPPHSEHIGTHSMMCKQEYSSRFNPFHAYMNLDIWTTANRNQSFPVSRDSGYCGNM
ncbi:hypothetical protein GDO81_000499 [Engystomops pustulosus]|uniref:Transmembrane protein 131-like N-terminal domain-containing protein n=1 Tax=Engystomops pustulosus TaxID=76066 RepID=A0AAV7D6Q8_ENGPU|nr:hypothetical protein GDO81_000499 [Engystomops pustulosus]